MKKITALGLGLLLMAAPIMGCDSNRVKVVSKEIQPLEMKLDISKGKMCLDNPDYVLRVKPIGQPEKDIYVSREVYNHLNQNQRVNLRDIPHSEYDENNICN